MSALLESIKNNLGITSLKLHFDVKPEIEMPGNTIFREKKKKKKREKMKGKFIQ